MTWSHFYSISLYTRNYYRSTCPWYLTNKAVSKPGIHRDCMKPGHICLYNPGAQSGEKAASTCFSVFMTKVHCFIQEHCHKQMILLSKDFQLSKKIVIQATQLHWSRLNRDLVNPKAYLLDNCFFLCCLLLKYSDFFRYLTFICFMAPSSTPVQCWLT